MAKAKLKVLSVKDSGDTWDITVDTNEEGRRILMQAGINQALKNMVDDNIDKLSWWERFKYAWKFANGRPNKKTISS